jgi:FkbM family methyltransferase
MNYAGHRDQHFGHITYSQHGEDLMLVNIFALLGIEKPSYLDLGAHHPVNISNTKLLYDRGSRGINVEANPSLIDAFKCHRPEDLNLNVGVGIASGMNTFYMYDEASGRNTFSVEETQKLKDVMTVRTAKTLPVVTLKDIVGTHCSGKFPALLSCDIEGLDYSVLATADFSLSQPVVIIVETRLGDTNKMTTMLGDKGFKLLCRMGENLIFIHEHYHYGVFHGRAR